MNSVFKKGVSAGLSLLLLISVVFVLPQELNAAEPTAVKVQEVKARSRVREGRAYAGKGSSAQRQTKRSDVRTRLSELVAETGLVSPYDLTQKFSVHFVVTLDYAKEKLDDPDTSDEVLKERIIELEWLLKRVDLSKYMHTADLLTPSDYEKARWDLVKSAREDAEYVLMFKSTAIVNTIAIERRIEKLENDFKIALEHLRKMSVIENAQILYGEEKVDPKTLGNVPDDIAPYMAKVKVYMKDKKIVHVADDNTDTGPEHNWFYHGFAKSVMRPFSGMPIQKAKDKARGLYGFDVISGATVSSVCIQRAISKALNRYKEPEIKKAIKIKGLKKVYRLKKKKSVTVKLRVGQQEVKALKKVKFMLYTKKNGRLVKLKSFKVRTLMKLKFLKKGLKAKKTVFYLRCKGSKVYKGFNLKFVVVK